MKTLTHPTLLIFLLTIGACTAPQKQERTPHYDTSKPYLFEYTTEAVPDWTNLFYKKSGWFGGDGIFSVALNGVDKQGTAANQKTLLWFGDTYIGDVNEEGVPLPGNVMVNNTVAYFEGIEPLEPNIQFQWKKSPTGEPETFFVPNNANSKPDQYYWLGDGFINQELNNRFYAFAYHVEMTGPNVFDFRLPNVSILAIDNPNSPPFDGYRQITSPFHFKNEKVGEGDLGAGVLVNTEGAGAPFPDGYVYVYGCIGESKSLVAARVKPADFENFERWRYWNGSEWSESITSLGETTNGASNELSVTPLKDGRYILVFQVLGVSDKVGIRIGTSPVGPFGPIEEIWTTPEINDPPGLLPYNAKAHPHLSKPGELLISYNTITFDFWNDIQKDAHIYRPRFIKLKSETLK